mgnify:CR=1 FL=1
MSFSHFQLPVASRPTVDFLQGLAVNEASDTVDLVLPWRNPFAFIRAISIIATQNLAYELMLFERAVNLGGTLPTDYFSAVWQFGPMVVGPPASPGWPVTPVGQSPGDPFYHYYIDGNMMPYRDLDQMDAASSASGGTFPSNGKLHVRLINRSATAKEANELGALTVIFYVASVGAQV